MSDYMNDDDLTQQAVFDFSKLKKVSNDTEEEDNSETVSKPLSNREQMAIKLDTAKMFARKEMQQFKKLVEQFATDLEELCLFSPAGNTAKNIFINQILEGVVEPIFNGTKPMGWPEEYFRTTRADMYQTLINKYIDKKDEE